MAGLDQIGPVLAGIIQHLRSAAGRLFNRVRATIREATRPIPVSVGLIAEVTRSPKQLLMENALLRQQLIVAYRKAKRPIFKAHERGFVVLLASLLPHWRNALLLVKPETVQKLKDEVIAAQRTDVDTVSGATATSKAYLKAVENALSTTPAK